MILASELKHRLTVYKRTVTQGPDGEPVPTYTPLATVNALVDPKAGRLDRDTTERVARSYNVITAVSDAIRAGMWAQATIRTVKGDVRIMTGQILEVVNPNFENDHLELRIQDGGDPINV